MTIGWDEVSDDIIMMSVNQSQKEQANVTFSNRCARSGCLCVFAKCSDILTGLLSSSKLW